MKNAFANRFASNKFNNYAKGPAKTRGNYAASKLACVVFAFELQRRLVNASLDSKVKTLAVDPGGVFTDIWRNEAGWKQAIMRWLLLTPSQGAHSSFLAATRSTLRGGSWIVPYCIRVAWMYNCSPSFAYYFQVLGGKLFLGCSQDLCAPKSQSREAANLLLEISRQACVDAGIKALPF